MLARECAYPRFKSQDLAPVELFSCQTAIDTVQVRFGRYDGHTQTPTSNPPPLTDMAHLAGRHYAKTPFGFRRQGGYKAVKQLGSPQSRLGLAVLATPRRRRPAYFLSLSVNSPGFPRRRLSTRPISCRYRGQHASSPSTSASSAYSPPSSSQGSHDCGIRP